MLFIFCSKNELQILQFEIYTNKHHKICKLKFLVKFILNSVSNVVIQPRVVGG